MQYEFKPMSRAEAFSYLLSLPFYSLKQALRKESFFLDESEIIKIEKITGLVNHHHYNLSFNIKGQRGIIDIYSVPKTYMQSHTVEEAIRSLNTSSAISSLGKYYSKMGIYFLKYSASMASLFLLILMIALPVALVNLNTSLHLISFEKMNVVYSLGLAALYVIFCTIILISIPIYYFKTKTNKQNIYFYRVLAKLECLVLVAVYVTMAFPAAVQLPKTITEFRKSSDYRHVLNYLKNRNLKSEIEDQAVRKVSSETSVKTK